MRSASFGANPFAWIQSTLSPGLREKRSNREIDAAKRTETQDDSQSIFDTVTPEVEKAQQADTKVTGVRQSDHVRECIMYRVQQSLTACLAQILDCKFQNLTPEAQQTRPSDFWKAYRLGHLADDVQREAGEQAHS